MKATVLDTETHLITNGLLAPPMVSLGFADVDFEEETVSPVLMLHAKQENVHATAKKIVEDEKTAIGQNIPYDFGVLAAHNKHDLMPAIFAKYRRNEVYDTRIADHMAHIAAGWTKGRPDGEYPKFSLGDIARRTLGIKVEGKEGADIWRLRYSELDDVLIEDWPKAAFDYAVADVDITGRVAIKQMPYLSRLATYDIQVKANWALHLMSCWGLRVDNKAVSDLKKSFASEIARDRAEFIAAGFVRTNGKKNMAAIGEAVEEAYEIMNKKCPRTPSGKPSTSNQNLMHSGNATLVKLANWGKFQKLMNTFIPVLELGLGGSIHPSYQTLVDTARTSSFKPNIQQLPRKGGIRECFIPRRGYVYIAADYHVAELCSLAQVLLKVLGASKMAEALQAGKDLHINTAASIMGIKYEDALRRYDEGDKEAEEIRQISKVLNFGLPGGLGANGFVGYAAGFGFNISHAESHRLRNLWLSEYPEMTLYFKWINSQMGMGNSFTSIHPITGFVRGNVGYCDGANHQFQHLTATGAKIALFDVAEQCYVDMGTKLFGCRPVAFIHDEILMEAPIEYAHEAAEQLKIVMESSMAQVITDIPCKVDTTMMRRWYKSAKPTYKNGRLVPWEPKN